MDISKGGMGIKRIHGLAQIYRLFTQKGKLMIRCLLGLQERSPYAPFLKQCKIQYFSFIQN